MSQFQEFCFPSSTGENTIHCLKCLPEKPARGIVILVHGIAEHIQRYRPFMAFLAENGFVAAGMDLLGFGQNIKSPSDKGFFAEENGWNYVVTDIDRLLAQVKAAHPGLPCVLFGHSMGSFLSRTYIIRYPGKFDAVILSGTGHQSPLLVRGGLLMAETFVLLKGAHYPAKALNDVAFGSYNKGFDSVRTDFDWLSRDPAAVDAYIADPLCGFICTASLYRDMMQGIRFITDPANIAHMDKKTPVFFLSGADDPVGDKGAGVTRAYKAFCDAGVRDVFLRLYPGGRHEMLNEINKDEVYQDVLHWIEEKLFPAEG